MHIYPLLQYIFFSIFCPLLTQDITLNRGGGARAYWRQDRTQAVIHFQKSIKRIWVWGKFGTGAIKGQVGQKMDKSYISVNMQDIEILFLHLKCINPYYMLI